MLRVAIIRRYNLDKWMYNWISKSKLRTWIGGKKLIYLSLLVYRQILLTIFNKMNYWVKFKQTTKTKVKIFTLVPYILVMIMRRWVNNFFNKEIT